jgi:hypothetical protein
VDDLEKLPEESRCLECELPIVMVDIEHATLRSRIRGGFNFVDRRSNTVNVEDACKCETAESGTDDRDGSIYGAPSVTQEPNQRATARRIDCSSGSLSDAQAVNPSGRIRASTVSSSCISQIKLVDLGRDS